MITSFELVGRILPIKERMDAPIALCLRFGWSLRVLHYCYHYTENRQVKNKIKGR